jgi:hypothetical protein
MAGATQGFLLIADISGYTGYLSTSELEHARDTLAALLNVLVDGARPPFVVSKLEGDAVFSYSEDGKLLVGQTLVEMIEAIYVAFRRAIDLMVLNNTCGCNACANVSSLDLKLLVHHGSFVIQQIGGHPELIGSDVNLAHRLLKNSITSETGIRGYTAYTDDAIELLGRSLSEGMTRMVEAYEDVGEVVIWVADMHPVWEARKDSQLVTLGPDQVDVEMSVEIDLPVEVVWDYLADPEFRNVLIGADRQEIIGKEQGRVSTGSAYLCYHGDRVVRQLILEWKPFERIVTRDRIGMMGDTEILDILELRSEGDRTVITQKVGSVSGPGYARLIAPLFLRMMRRVFQRDGDRFARTIEDDHREKTGEALVPA